MPPDTPSLEELRARILEIDAAIIDLVSRRLATASQIGRHKRKAAAPVRDYARERRVMEHARECAARSGVDPALAQDLIARLVRAAVSTQEREVVTTSSRGTGKSALVIGGLGKIGGWFSNFLASSGFQVRIADPAVAAETDTARRDWRGWEQEVDLIVVATPLHLCAGVLEELANRRPGGVVCDVASIKTPIAAQLDALRKTGCRSVSLHPMFGPDADTLMGRQVIIMDNGDAEATAMMRDLFSVTMAHCIELPLAEHDALIAYVLGLSHLINIAFFQALQHDPQVADRLVELSSSSFDAQLRVARRIARENPHLYYEIQHANPHRAAAHQALHSALDAVNQAVETGEVDAFVRIMERGRAYLDRLFAHHDRRPADD